MAREINLDGGEITILKSIGLSGTQIFGKLLLDRTGELDTTEFVQTLDGLLSLGYVLSNRVNVRTREDVECAFFRVNPAYSRDLRDAVNPGRRRTREPRKRRR
ncbi:MAG TPA: hypothetical protein VGQ82_03430 [Chthoniobacterales bacterium]|nr:hypothetical protein [Chthoniobacterales bacterium]